MERESVEIPEDYGLLRLKGVRFMFLACVVLLRSMRKLGGAMALALWAYSSSFAQSPTAPTSSQAPESIDEVWQKASSKYDAQRVGLLKDVENADREGPYRADWDSLKD